MVVAGIAIAALMFAQRPEPTASLLARMDSEHDLAAKERLLNTITRQDAGAGPWLLRLAKTTANVDTRWMAIRGMAKLRYTECGQFLEESLKDSDAFVRANAARALGDLGIKDAASALLSMFAAEREGPAVEQASLALRLLNVKAAAPYIREKIPVFTGQTRGWLIQALGTLGERTGDVPLVAGYLDERMSGMAATEAIAELAGVSFGPKTMGLSGYPPRETIAAVDWWKAHREKWPQCDDCHAR